jgi:NADPH-dependent ferric siderophore reductase
MSSWMYRHIHSDAQNFVTCKINNREKISNTADIFTLERYEPWYKRFMLGHSADIMNAFFTGAWHMEFKQPQIQVVRAYTPLPAESGFRFPMDGHFPLQFLIRREHNGEVSSWLHRLPIGAEVQMRGPYIEYEVPTEPSRVVILAGGTGIATALQVATATLEDGKASNEVGGPLGSQDRSKPGTSQVHILWASRKRADCQGGLNDDGEAAAVKQRSQRASQVNTAPGMRNPAHANSIVKRLEGLKAKFPGRVTVSYFVDEEGTFINRTELQKSVCKWSPPLASMSPDPSTYQPPSRTEILISGPDGFIAALAGPKVWEYGRQTQGPLGGVLNQVIANLNSEQKNALGKITVYKL